MSATYSISQISTLTGRKVFFDANIVIYIFWPTGSQHWENQYASAFNNLMTQQNELVVDFMVISEVINRIIRIEYEKHLVTHQLTRQVFSYKTYRDSTEGESAMNDIYLIVKHTILPLFSVSGKTFSKNEIETFLTLDTLDFTDKGVVQLCIENNFVLLTNDKDFKQSGVDILSSNPALL